MLNHKKNDKNQKGAVLVISLIFLMLLTLLSISGMQLSSLQEKMVGNSRDKNLAFQAAESALNAAEQSLDPAGSLPTFVADGSSSFYTSNTSTDLSHSTILNASFWVDSNGDATNAVLESTVSGSALGNNINTPLYFIQYLGTQCFHSGGCDTTTIVPAFKIIARATGGSTSAVVVLQSLFTLPNGTIIPVT